MQADSREPQKIREAIVLAGGLGTRLREAVPDLPKCMATVAGRPFLYYVIRSLRLQGIERIVFSLGYKHEVIERWLHDEFASLEYDCVVEAEPLGTGGAIVLAAQHAVSDNVLIVNGDTLFKIDLSELLSFHLAGGWQCSLALKPMKDFDRYGVVRTDEKGMVLSFEEKSWVQTGNINGGVYLLNREWLLAQQLPLKFSFETDLLEKNAGAGTLGAIVQNGYFIDIGIPADFNKADKDLIHAGLQLSDIGEGWTLFLDRDGVINEDKPGSYIFSPEEFHFMPGAPAIFAELANRFSTILVVTNQRGVGKQLMTEETLQVIHHQMREAIVAAGGRIDAIYYASSLSNKDPLRKPNPGMALRARRDFPTIDFSRSIMIGNNISDMQFGRNAGMYTVFLTTTNPHISLPHPDIDLIFPDLQHFVKAL